MGSLVGAKPKAPPPPPAPVVMPEVDDEAVKAAKKRAAAAQVMRSGRDSTVLTQRGADGTATPNQSPTMGG